MRLIDGDNVRDNLQQLLIDDLGDTENFVDGVRQGIELAIAVIDEHLTVDAEPIRHGHWMLHPDCKEWYICSYCGNRHIFSLDYDCRYFRWLSPYCPNCGAKMDEEVEE